MPGQAHVYFTAFSSGLKSAGHVLCKIVREYYDFFLLICNNNNITNFAKMSFGE